MANDSSPKPQDRGRHVHDDAHQIEAERLGRQREHITYCWICYTWIAEEAWLRHCRTHLDSLDIKRCGTVVYCKTVLRPAFCPFCIGNTSFQPSYRIKTWSRDYDLRLHIEGHLLESVWPRECPHPSCKAMLDTLELCRFHFIDDHGLQSHHRSSKNSLETGAFIEYEHAISPRLKSRSEQPVSFINTTKKERTSNTSPGPGLALVYMEDIMFASDTEESPRPKLLSSSIEPPNTSLAVSSKSKRF